MEAVDIRFLTQSQLIEIANKIAKQLDRENYEQTLLYQAGKTADIVTISTGCWREASK